jgi:hypothetical protein
MRFGATAGASRASLRVFDSATNAEARGALEHGAATVFADYYASRRWAFSLAMGAISAGKLDLSWPDHAEHLKLSPGFLATASASYVVADEAPNKPFVLTGMTLGVGVNGAVPESGGASERMIAGDLRLSITAGKTFADAFRPYASARVFGGPVLLGGRATGTDRYHLQPAVGLAVILSRGFDLFAEVAPVFEQAVSVGLGFSPGR